MSDIHALSGAYAVDALDDAERTQFEQHLETCPECRAEVRSFCETAALITEASTETPPPSLRAGVLAGIGAVRPLPPETPDTSEPSEVAPGDASARHLATGRRTARRWFPALVAAAVAVILLAAGALVWQPWHSGAGTSVADQVLHASDAVRTTEELPGGGSLTVVRSASLKRAVMVADHVAAPPAGKVYQLWLQQPGAGMVSAGLMADPTAPTVLAGDAATAKAAAITVEPDTGSSKPTSAPIATFPFRAST
jgi:anti-sigma-K factor RskA